VAAALKLAGASHVAVVVLGRHVNPADPRSVAFVASLRAAGERGDRWPWRGPPSAIPTGRRDDSAPPVIVALSGGGKETGEDFP
jgi:hypothetical protein